MSLHYTLSYARDVFAVAAGPGGSVRMPVIGLKLVSRMMYVCYVRPGQAWQTQLPIVLATTGFVISYNPTRLTHTYTSIV